MAQLPVARVIQGGTLGPAPRGIPPALWFLLALGHIWAQLMWTIITVAVWPCVLIVVLDPMDPETRRLAGILGVIAIVLAVVFAGFQAWWARRQAYLLRHGHQTTGQLTKKEEVVSGESSSTYYTFRYRDDAGSDHEVTIRSAADNRWLEDETNEPMLYDPARPGDAIPLDHVPGRPRIDEAGNWRASRTPIDVLILPALTLVGIVILELVAR